MLLVTPGMGVEAEHWLDVRDRPVWVDYQLWRHNDAGDVRWTWRRTSAEMTQLRGGVRIIYFNRLADGKVWLMAMYAKNVREDIDVKILVKIRETLDGKAQRKGTGKVRG